MTEEEKIVQQSQRQERKHNFELMKSFLQSIRDDARKYVEAFKDKYYVPEYVVRDCGIYTYSREPHINYDFDFNISYALSFRFNSNIALTIDGDVRYMLCVKMVMNEDEEDPLSGCIYLHYGSFEKYIDAMKQACDACYKKYVELHENMKNRFF